jgi:two-component system NtrC family response regulator
LATEAVDGILLDLRMQGGIDGIEVLRRIRAGQNPPPVVVLTAFASAENTIEAMRLGAFDHLTKPIGRRDLSDLIARLLPRPSAAPDPDTLEDRSSLIGSSDAMRRIHKAIGLAADSDATILVFGETGTGKELVARALHEHGRRSNRPFIAVNCAAIPGELLESELFGHVRGAFTGAATDRAGAFREASGGTLFLDEIGDMPPGMQAKILRALQEKVMTPVGGKPVNVDARVIAATHRDLANMVEQGRFREDLYYRLNVVPITLPPLRERQVDILPLARYFLHLSRRQNTPKRLTQAAEACLLEYSWPGNVRELRNVIERANVLVRGDVIDAADLTPADGPDHRISGADLLEDDLQTAVAKLETAMIQKALQACGGNRAEAARRLNINRQLLYAKMQRYGLARHEMSPNPTQDVGKADS